MKNRTGSAEWSLLARRFAASSAQRLLRNSISGGNTEARTEEGRNYHLLISHEDHLQAVRAEVQLGHRFASSGMDVAQKPQSLVVTAGAF